MPSHSPEKLITAAGVGAGMRIYGLRMVGAFAVRVTASRVEWGLMGSTIERIKACLNGGRRRDEHPAVPITAVELAEAAAAAVTAGAEAVHLHQRDRAVPSRCTDLVRRALAVWTTARAGGDHHAGPVYR